MGTIPRSKVIGMVCIGLAFGLAYFGPMHTISTANLAILVSAGMVAWWGVGQVITHGTGLDFKMWKLLLKGAVGLGALMGVLLLGIIRISRQDDQELTNYGAVANGVVVAKSDVALPNIKTGVSYVNYLTIEFVDGAGRRQRIETEVSDREFEAAYPGQYLKVYYSERNPAVHRVAF